jgi:hypothetical protein
MRTTNPMNVRSKRAGVTRRERASSNTTVRVAAPDDARAVRGRLLGRLGELERDWGGLAVSKLGEEEARHVHTVLHAMLVATLFATDPGDKRRAQQWLAQAAQTARPILGMSGPARAARARIKFLRNILAASPEGGHQNALSLVAFFAFGGRALRRDTPKLQPEAGIDEDGIRPRSGDVKEALAAVETAFAKRIRRDDWRALRPYQRAEALILVGLMALGCPEVRARNLLRAPF